MSTYGFFLFAFWVFKCRKANFVPHSFILCGLLWKGTYYFNLCGPPAPGTVWVSHFLRQIEKKPILLLIFLMKSWFEWRILESTTSVSTWRIISPTANAKVATVYSWRWQAYCHGSEHIQVTSHWLYPQESYTCVHWVPTNMNSTVCGTTTLCSWGTPVIEFYRISCKLAT
jgi:hypothetical protein